MPVWASGGGGGGGDERFDILRRHLLEMSNFSADSVLTGMVDE